LLEGEIISLSNDAISDENHGLVYLKRVLLNETQIMVNNKLVNLSPGMSVSVEVKTGQRRIIEYFQLKGTLPFNLAFVYNLIHA